MLAAFADEARQRTHVVGVVVATRQQASARWRAQRRDVEVGKARASVCEPLHCRHVNQSTVGRQVTVANVVHDPNDDVWLAQGCSMFGYANSLGADFIESARDGGRILCAHGLCLMVAGLALSE